MKLTKFPVISPSGAEYRVDVYKAYRSPFDVVGVKVYAERKGKRWFRWKCVLKCEFFEKVFDEDFGGSFVELARNGVVIYEGKLAAKRRERKRIEQFREWDSVIRREEAN